MSLLTASSVHYRAMDSITAVSAKQLDDVLCTMNSASSPLEVEISEARIALQRDGEELLNIDFVLDSLHAEIEAIHVRISLQREKRCAVESRILENKARISPVKFLPTEILQQIFKSCLPNDRYVIPHIMSAPLLLCQICRRWRDIAQATPELWSSIDVHDWGIWTADIYTAMVTRWLAAARTRPLAVSVVCLQKWDWFRHYDPTQSGLFRLLASHSVQFHDLHIQASRGYIDAFMTSGSYAMKHLLISVMPTSFLVNSGHPLTLCTSNVTHVALCGKEALINLIPRATFPQITHLTLDRPGAEVDFTKILFEFPALIKLKIKLFVHGESLDMVTPPSDATPLIKHQTLEILSIYLSEDAVQFGDVAPLARIFDSLSLPSLRELAFLALGPRWQAVVDEWLPDSVKVLFSGSSCSAKRLLYRNFKHPLDLDGCREQLKNHAIDLRVDNAGSGCHWYDIAS
ncbi:hypothetical protein DEU56DRAFT_771399 [Suillus clintonianus]|uniref:uncharacterized protein n=1 Tax=Suillus clintonianus TaxID=1904413 RepID=UPI001B86F93D|nr:uncharacterized protein DEU56DRAFT_771399 [Suillus clintonianus]KAG2153855.1 hypothetical protein DEU56DRAFT_771399 [Suillus clintonianus]